MINYKNLFFSVLSMNILAFADTHARKSSLKKLVKKARHADVLVCAGDLSLFGEGLQESTELLANLGKPLLVIPGNHENKKDIEALTALFPHVIPLHGKTHTLDEVVFFGYGEGGFSFIEPGMEKFLASLSRRFPPGKKRVFVTHAPPYHTTLDYLAWFPGHRGCKTAVKVIKHLKPDLALCGHFHENMNKQCKIGKSIVMNPGCDGTLITL
jgi:uncharacterized protein